MRRRQSVLGDYKTVCSVPSGVDNAGVSGILVLKNKELVAEQVHLKDSFFRRHRLEFEGFGPDYEPGVLFKLYVLWVAVVEHPFSESFFKAGLVFVNLPLDCLYRAVKRIEECLLVYLAAEKGVGGVDCDLYVCLVAFPGKGDCSLSFL